MEPKTGAWAVQKAGPLQVTIRIQQTVLEWEVRDREKRGYSWQRELSHQHVRRVAKRMVRERLIQKFSRSARRILFLLPGGSSLLLSSYNLCLLKTYLFRAGLCPPCSYVDVLIPQIVTRFGIRVIVGIIS